MAADSNQYTGNSLISQKDGATTAHLVAKPQWDFEQAKTLFYLDHIHPVQIGATVVGFIGACEVGSANYLMHNTARLGNLRKLKELSAGDWREYRLFMDGGLNTKALPINAPHNRLEGSAVDVTVRPAVFVAPTTVKLYYRPASVDDTPIGAWTLGAQRIISTANEQVVSFGVASDSLPTSNAEWRFDAENAEGAITSASAFFRAGTADNQTWDVSFNIAYNPPQGGQGASWTMAVFFTNTTATGTQATAISEAVDVSVNIADSANGYTASVGGTVQPGLSFGTFTSPAMEITQNGTGTATLAIMTAGGGDTYNLVGNPQTVDLFASGGTYEYIIVNNAGLNCNNSMGQETYLVKDYQDGRWYFADVSQGEPYPPSNQLVSGEYSHHDPTAGTCAAYTFINGILQ